jgi:hypothetical protein
MRRRCVSVTPKRASASSVDDPDGSDPFAVLGLTFDASLDEVRAARRRLALTLHPDVGGDPAAMRRLNEAFEMAVAHLTGRRPLPVGDDTPAPPPPQHPPARQRSRFGLQRDEPSFTMNVLPVEAFEALLVATSWIGEVLVDEPPYVLEVFLREPSPCWCRLDLVPDAGGSTVTLTVARVGDEPAPDVEAVRDVWVAHLNELGG